jgi:hypothetical protein
MLVSKKGEVSEKARKLHNEELMFYTDHLGEIKETGLGMWLR